MEILNQILINEPLANALVTVQTTDDVFLLCFRNENDVDFTVYATEMKIKRYQVKKFQYIVNTEKGNIFIRNVQQKRIPIFKG